MEWKDIYRVCNHYFVCEGGALKQAVAVREVPISKERLRMGKPLQGYDWVRKDEVEPRITRVSERPESWYWGEWGQNKGTLCTAEHLVRASEDEELRIAIWLYAFLEDMERKYPASWTAEAYEIFFQVRDGVYEFLQARGVSWHHAMKKLLPQRPFPWELLEQVQLSSEKILIELALSGAELVFHRYQVLFYYMVDK